MDVKICVSGFINLFFRLHRCGVSGFRNLCLRLYRCGVGGIKLPPLLAFKSTLWQASFPGLQWTLSSLHAPIPLYLRAFKVFQMSALPSADTHVICQSRKSADGFDSSWLTPQNINKWCLKAFIHRETGTSTGWETNSGTNLIRLLVKPYSITSF